MHPFSPLSDLPCRRPGINTSGSWKGTNVDIGWKGTKVDIGWKGTNVDIGTHLRNRFPSGFRYICWSSPSFHVHFFYPWGCETGKCWSFCCCRLIWEYVIRCIGRPSPSHTKVLLQYLHTVIIPRVLCEKELIRAYRCMVEAIYIHRERETLRLSRQRQRQRNKAICLYYWNIANSAPLKLNYQCNWWSTLLPPPWEEGQF